MLSQGSSGSNIAVAPGDSQHPTWEGQDELPIRRQSQLPSDFERGRLRYAEGIHVRARRSKEWAFTTTVLSGTY